MPKSVRRRKPSGMSRAPPRQVARGSRGGEALYELRPGDWKAAEPQVSFPDRARVCLLYETHNDYAPGVAYRDHVFRLNSLFDPDYTETGHQPRDYDTWSGLYTRYRVHEVEVEVLYYTTATEPALVYAVPTNVTNPLTPTEFPAELPRANLIGIVAAGTPPVHKKFRLSPAAILGMSKAQYSANENVQALVVANPAVVAYLHMYTASVDASTALAVRSMVRIRYYCEIFERQTQSPSVSRRLVVSEAPRAQSDEEEMVLVKVPRAGGAASAAAAAAQAAVARR